MKELTIEEKAKAYDEAIERYKAKQEYESKRVHEFVEYLFPSLKESEDEKIREALIRYHKSTIDIDGIKGDEIVSWLEKQSKQKSAVETKLKIEEGKWYVCISQFCNCIEGRAYKATSDSRIMDDFGTEYDMHSDAYKYFRLWTIQDAKEGDVLVNKHGCPLIFKDRKTCWCYYSISSEVFRPNSNKWFFSSVDYLYPATKEQRNLLFQKMKEAGYKWDAEKKKLKKIEQNNDWSEDDKKKIKLLIDILNVNHPNAVFKVNPIGTTDMEVMSKDELVSWLKSIRSKNLWKPTEEQMDAVYSASLHISWGAKNCKILQSLYSDLKQL